MKHLSEIQMGRVLLLIQAIGGEGYVYVKGYDDLQFFEKFIVHSDERLKSSRKLMLLKTLKKLMKSYRVLLFAPFIRHISCIRYSKTYPLRYRCGLNKATNLQTDDSPTTTFYPSILTPRPIVDTEDYDKIVELYVMVSNYVYDDIYTQMIEMTRDLEL
ncbi:DUF2529 family protein [Staphylococcus aureus]